MATSARTIPPPSEVRELVDRLIVPLLVERFLREHAASRVGSNEASATTTEELFDHSSESPIA
jgi:hypothetical protein